MAKSGFRSSNVSETAGNLAWHPASVIGLGVVAVVAGVIILAWPGATAHLIALVFGIFMLVSGVFQLIAVMASDERVGGGRTSLTLLGLVSIVVGLLVLRHPIQTVVALTLLLGLFWMVSGLLGTVRALGSSGSGRGWAIGAGLVSVAAGIAALVYPAVTVVVLVWLLGLQLVVTGAFGVVRGLQARREVRSATHPSITSPRSAPDAETAPEGHRTGPSSG